MRSFLYFLARLLGDLNALSRGPEATARRIVRKSVYRSIFSWLRRL